MIRSEDIVLTVGGKEFEAYRTLKVSMSFTDLYNELSFDIWDANKPNQTRQKLPVKEYDEVELMASGDKLFSGFICAPSGRQNKDNWALNFVAQTKSGLLEDSSVEKDRGCWTKATLLQICKDVCKKFGITVRVEPSAAQAKGFGELFNRICLNDGETGLALIRRLAQARGVMVYTDVNGDLVLSRASQETHPDIIYAEEVFGDFSFQKNTKDRHSHYVVTSQHFGNDNLKGEATAHGYAIVRDDGVPFYCPLVIRPNFQGGHQDLQTKGEWERNARIAAGYTVNFALHGWRDSQGKLWTPNTRCHVIAERFDIDEIFLITKTYFTVDDEGFKCGLELTHPDAFEPEIAPKSRKKGSSLS